MNARMNQKSSSLTQYAYSVFHGTWRLQQDEHAWYLEWYPKTMKSFEEPQLICRDFAKPEDAFDFLTENNTGIREWDGKGHSRNVASFAGWKKIQVSA